MRIVKIIGLLIFLSGFVFFNASFFWSQYRLTEEVIREKITDKQKQDLFAHEAASIIGKEFPSAHKFISSLHRIFDQVNQKQLERYQVTDEDIKALIQRSNNKLLTPAIDSVFRTSNEAAAFKKKA